MNPITVIDNTTFNTLKETMGADFVIELVNTYEEETPRLIATLQEALLKQDCEAFRRAAHSIKSTSNSLGALQFGEMAKELEMMGRAGNLAGAAKKVETLVSTFVEVKQAFEKASHD